MIFGKPNRKIYFCNFCLFWGSGGGRYSILTIVRLILLRSKIIIIAFVTNINTLKIKKLETRERERYYALVNFTPVNRNACVWRGRNFSKRLDKCAKFGLKYCIISIYDYHLKINVLPQTRSSMSKT